MRGSPMPQMSLTASAAIVDPTRPQRTPRTPPSAQVGTESASGMSGKRSRSIGP
ncbi:Uncharacterised protein [Mycobacteroides abscessus subsp. abscessus]|nr:Uncharacterised protein [Mycobacteroides abscessus subsp. abscessus]